MLAHFRRRLNRLFRQAPFYFISNFKANKQLFLKIKYVTLNEGPGGGKKVSRII